MQQTEGEPNLRPRQKLEKAGDSNGDEEYEELSLVLVFSLKSNKHNRVFQMMSEKGRCFIVISKEKQLNYQPENDLFYILSHTSLQQLNYKQLEGNSIFKMLPLSLKRYTPIVALCLKFVRWARSSEAKQRFT